MTLLVYVALVLGSGIFVVGSLVRAVQFARLPLHLRWELYPVPHEGERARHGGSYFESSEWWTARRHFALVAEVKAMITEIVFLKALYEFNRPLWRRSFPFHFGLYLLAGAIGLILLEVLAGPDGVGTVRPLLAATHAGCLVTGTAGLVLTLVGAAGLLHRRWTDHALAPYTTPGDLFNLVFFLVALGLAGAGYLLRPTGAPGPVAIVRGLLAWNTALAVSPLFATGLVAAALLAAYIPLTHMSHFVAKYFTYHQVRWDDAAMQGNASLQARMAEYLTYRPTWAARHVLTDGPKSWAQLASAPPPDGRRK